MVIVSVWAGRSPLCTVTVCLPGDRQSERSGGLMPRLRPSTDTSPQGWILSRSGALQRPSLAMAEGVEGLAVGEIAGVLLSAAVGAVIGALSAGLASPLACAPSTV